MNDDPVLIFEEDGIKALRAMADRLCGGSDKMRDEGNLLVTLMAQAIPSTQTDLECGLKGVG